MEERQLAVRKRHQVTLQNREKLSIDGVTHVESFDDMEIVLQTDAGTLVIRGEGLHIKELNIDSSNLAVTGHVTAMEYTDEAGDKKGRGLLGKLFK
ncbi:MAG TPA: sporulation protein YabP [Firmicutes bacterium]|nr:sporulation protein YabP [Bacillota bacterium]